MREVTKTYKPINFTHVVKGKKYSFEIISYEVKDEGNVYSKLHRVGYVYYKGNQLVYVSAFGDNREDKLVLDAKRGIDAKANFIVKILEDNKNSVLKFDNVCHNCGKKMVIPTARYEITCLGCGGKWDSGRAAGDNWWLGL